MVVAGAVPSEASALSLTHVSDRHACTALSNDATRRFYVLDCYLLRRAPDNIFELSLSMAAKYFSASRDSAEKLLSTLSKISRSYIYIYKSSQSASLDADETFERRRLHFGVDFHRSELLKVVILKEFP